MSAASEGIREFLQRLNAANPGSGSGTFLDKIEALLKERDEMRDLLQKTHGRLLNDAIPDRRPLERWAEEIDDLLTRVAGDE